MKQYIPIFLAIILIQSILSMYQVTLYKKEINKIRGGTRFLGVGARRGGLKGGRLLLVAMNRDTLIVEECRQMKGITVFSAFKELPEYIGLTLEELRVLGLEEDARINKRYRQKHPYNPIGMDKRKGAIIQAVEVIDRQLARMKEKKREEAPEFVKA